MSTYPSDLEIANSANKISIDKVAATIDITDKDLINLEMIRLKSLHHWLKNSKKIKMES